ncbi:MAG: EF-hand domain-containing protein, partial [Promethearchaeia archaeon]
MADGQHASMSDFHRHHHQSARRDLSLPPWRRSLIWFVTHPVLMTLVNLTALLSTILMALKDIHASDSIKLTDRIVDYSVTGLFGVEIAFKVFALGWRRKKKKGEEKEDTEEGEGTEESADPGATDAMDQQKANPADLLTPQEHASIKAMFELFDTDNNLTMDEFELRVAMRGLGFGVTRQHAHRIFVSIDTDNSGSIDYDEFERMMAERMVKESPIDGFMDSDWNRLDLYLVVFRLLMFPLMFLPDGHGLFMNALA